MFRFGWEGVMFICWLESGVGYRNDGWEWRDGRMSDV